MPDYKRLTETSHWPEWPAVCRQWGPVVWTLCPAPDTSRALCCLSSAALSTPAGSILPDTASSIVMVNNCVCSSHTHIHTHTHTHTCTDTHAHMCTRQHTHVHTHILIFKQKYSTHLEIPLNNSFPFTTRLQTTLITNPHPQTGPLNNTDYGHNTDHLQNIDRQHNTDKQ